MAFRKSEITPILQRVWDGDINLDQLPVEVFQFIFNDLIGQVEQGFGERMGEQVPGSSKDKFVQAAKTNVKSFTAHKVWRQVRDLQMVAETSNDVSEFNDRGEGVFRKYNEVWQQTEEQAAWRKSKSGKHWSQIVDNQDLFPLMTYRTQGDDRVRDEHEDLEGITRRVEDEFWDTYFPPNGWNCRCPKPRQRRSAPETDVDRRELSGPEPMFNNNPGKGGEVFPSDHPYFTAVPESFKEASKRDFGF